MKNTHTQHTMNIKFSMFPAGDFAGQVAQMDAEQYRALRDAYHHATDALAALHAISWEISMPEKDADAITEARHALAVGCRLGNVL